jgi:predicted MPP superfamily phosphohydrolase
MQHTQHQYGQQAQQTQQENLSRRRFLKMAAALAVAPAFAGGGGYVYATRLEPSWVEVEQVEITLPRLTPAFDGFRLVQISDLHFDNDWMTRERLLSVVELVNQQAPDQVVITGDFVSQRLNDDSKLALTEVLSKLPAKTLSVLGNHDHWARERDVRTVIKQSGGIDLSNYVWTLQRDGEQLHIAGVDDIWQNEQRLDIVLSNLPAKGAAILLAHEPDYADTSAATGRFDLQLSGHSHGGQVKLPFIGAPILPAMGQKYWAGLYQVGSMYQYTNRGLGMVRPYVRFNCRPEISVITLRSPLV